MPRILKETKRTVMRTRMEAMSGWVVRRRRKGERWVWAVLRIPKSVVMVVMSGERREGGRMVEAMVR